MAGSGTAAGGAEGAGGAGGAGRCAGRYLTHQNASHSPLSITRFLTIYAATRQNRRIEAPIRIRSRVSERSSAVTRVLEVVRSVPKAEYMSDVDCKVREDSSERNTDVSTLKETVGVLIHQTSAV